MLLREDAAVRPEEFREREHGAVDILMLLGIVLLAVVTWSYLSDVAGPLLWKLYLGVAISCLLGLAALTRHPHWSTSIRFLAGDG
jgi:uncharacterized membrane protein SirB2